MTNKRQLPIEVALSLKRVARWVKEGSLSAEYGVGYKEGIDIMEKEYATKLHEAQQECEKVDSKLLDAIDLLRKVFQKHESGLLPDRFIYEKIKRFLYGE
jgi:hypothetical protein